MFSNQLFTPYIRIFYTGRGKESKDQRTKKTGAWEPTRIQNLVRNTSSDVYYARFRIKGKLRWRTLDTESYTTAKLRLPDKIEEERKLVAAGDGQITPEQAAKIYQDRINHDPGLPEPEQFDKFLTELEAGGGRNSRKHILVRGNPETGTKGSEARVRRVPMIGEMKGLLQRLRAERPDESSNTGVMLVHECQKAMDRAAKATGMPRITHHDLRHLFATRCIESGVDIPTVSRWLGHKDGGGAGHACLWSPAGRAFSRDGQARHVQQDGGRKCARDAEAGGRVNPSPEDFPLPDESAVSAAQERLAVERSIKLLQGAVRASHQLQSIVKDLKRAKPTKQVSAAWSVVQQAVRGWVTHFRKK